MAKKLMDKIKEGVSIQEVEDFARKYTTEVMLVLAIVIAAFSSMLDFFSGPKLAIIFISLGLIFGIFFPAPIERGLKKFFGFSHKQEKMTRLVLASVEIVAALFIPFLLFGFIGLLGGTSYHYYSRHAQIMGNNKSEKSHRRSHGGEHD